MSRLSTMPLNASFSHIMTCENSPFELLAPGGNLDSIKAAIAAGADAVYCGLERFNARNRADNITMDDLGGVLRLAHAHQCQVFITLNIIIVDSEWPALINLLNRLVNTRIDGVIVQDLGLLYLLATRFKSLKIHASTQLNTHNEGQINFLSQLPVSRVNLSRELNLQEITCLTSLAHQRGMASEIFVHGSNCICFSGICYMSSVLGGTSGNRGRCSQPCRDQYPGTPTGKQFPLNLKDNSAYSDVREIAAAGVDALKIEGRMKTCHYVYSVVETWRKQLAGFYSHNRVNHDKTSLHKVFNRDFTHGFLKGQISQDMFIDDPRNQSAEMTAKRAKDPLEEMRRRDAFFTENDQKIARVKETIAALDTGRFPLTIRVSGCLGSVLKLSVITGNQAFSVSSENTLAAVRDTRPHKPGACRSEGIDEEFLLKRFQAVNQTDYFIEHLETKNLDADLSLPFADLNALKNKLLVSLNAREPIPPVVLPPQKKQHPRSIKPTLSVLISSSDDLYLADQSDATFYFRLPDSLENQGTAWVELLRNHPHIIPWFPAVLIGDDFTAAVQLLRELQPEWIVTDNTGIAYEANQCGVDWIAGPQLNSANAYSLRCLKEVFHCAGAFVASEINRIQLKRIRKPDRFRLFYSIYHPILMMTSRQCLFHQVTGCRKQTLDDACIRTCRRSATITNTKNQTVFIDKQPHQYHRIFNSLNYLNTAVVDEIQNKFSSFFIDLSRVETTTEMAMDKRGIVHLFERCIHGESGAAEQLHDMISPTTCRQYKTGI